MTEWTVNNKLNDWYEKQYHVKLPKKWETKSRLYFSLGTYSNFIPSGSDSLITADSLTFKSRASAVPTGEWVVVGTVVESAPLFDNPDAPSISGGALSGPAGIYRVVNATTVTDSEVTLTPPVALSSLGTPGDDLTIYYLQFSSESPSVVLPDGGFTATETWSSYVNGNTFTQLDANYARTNSNIGANIATDADGIAGLGCSFGLTAGNTPISIYRDDITAELATRLVTDRVQVLVKMRTVGDNSRAGFGWTNGTNFTGMCSIWNVSTSTLSIMTEGSLAGGSNKTDVLASIAPASVIWLRFEVEGADLRGKAWADGAGEPGSWMQTRIHSGNLTFSQFGLVTRAGGLITNCLGYSIGINADAPAI